MKIDIEAITDKQYKDIAILIDRPDFINAVEQIRIKWRLSKRYKLDEYGEFYDFICQSKTDDKRWAEFLKDVHHLRYIFKKTPNFDDVIMFAIGFDKIPSHAYKTCYLEAEPLDPSGKNGDEYKFQIVFSPETTRDEILEEFRKFKNGVAGKTDLEGYEWDVFPDKKIVDNTSPNIKRDREWYWLHQGGDMSYKEIFEKSVSENIAPEDRSGIVNAIKAYKKRLI